MVKLIEYHASPTLAKFHADPSFVRGVRGPVGSGKSVGMCMEIFSLACQQKPNRQGIRPSRWVVVRNSFPELKSTTIKTWVDWFPEASKTDPGFGKVTYSSPISYPMSYPLPDGTRVELEMLFMALDKPDDVKKLLSLEVSGGWINEAKEIPKTIVDGLRGRIGRYPSVREVPCSRPSLIMDTNPPDDQSWWFHWAEEKTPEDYCFWSQPGGLSDEAENLENLNQPDNFKDLTMAQRREIGRGYYKRIAAGADKEFVKVFVDGEYGQLLQGVPVYSMFNPDLHVAKAPIPVDPRATLYIGIDASGRHPAAVFAQKTVRGQWQVVHEMAITDKEGMGAVAFADLFARELKRLFPNNPVANPVWGDPAGAWGSQNDERSYFDILNDALCEHGLRVRASPGFRLPERLETVGGLLNRLIDGKPALILSSECKVLCGGMKGGYKFRELNTSNGDRTSEEPVKNRFSDVQDALQYLMCGVEMRNILTHNGGARQLLKMDTGFSVFG